MTLDFKAVPHTADLKLAVYGTTLEALFANALIGMFQSIKPKTEQSDCAYQNERLVCAILPVNHTISLSASDNETLLVAFLSEALALSDIHNEAYLAADIAITENYSLAATIRGIPIVGFEVVEIKAVTYAGLEIKKQNGVWSTEIVFDI